MYGLIACVSQAADVTCHVQALADALSDTLRTILCL